MDTLENIPHLLSVVCLSPLEYELSVESRIFCLFVQHYLQVMNTWKKWPSDADWTLAGHS